jgi:Mrp family chromosome partitioning ATPase
VVLAGAGPLYVDSLSGPHVKKLVADLGRLADVLVIDSPPVTEVSDALLFADVVEATLVAVRLGRTRRDRLDEVRQAFAQREISPLGFVVTSREPSRGRGYGYQRPVSVAELPKRDARAEEDAALAPETPTSR